MHLLIPLCFLAISSAVENQQYVNQPWELDRARSAWDFGGHHSKKGLKLLAQSRTVPGNFTAERRMGINLAPVRSQQAPFFRPNNVVNVSSAKQRSKPIKKQIPRVNSQIKGPLATSLKSSDNVHRRNPMQEKILSSFFSKNAPHGLKRRVVRKSKRYSMPRNRSPRKISSRSDFIKNNFRKEDLWHLDKGEQYQLKTEDLQHDFHKRYPHEEHQNHEHEPKHEDHEEKHKIEMEAEKMVKDAGNLYDHKQHHKHEHDGIPCKKDHAPVHIHHHHHHDKKEKEKKHDDKHGKKLGPRKLIPAPLPRIHNPIPLGCLITLPVFHPIRPRHHLGCFLSIPGTPNLMKKRRRRSADIQYGSPVQHNPNVNQGFMSGAAATRKYYNNHIGPGPQSYAQAPLTNLAKSNYKIPATIITPPKFDKSDIMQMLTGTGVGPNDVGKILMTNNRYVRIGRGLPNSGKKSRSLWGPAPMDSPSPQYQTPAAPQVIPVKQQSNMMPNSLVPNTVMKPPLNTQRNPFVALTPVMPSPTHQLTSHPISSQSSPVVVIPVDQLKNLILTPQYYNKGQFSPSPSVPVSHTPSDLHENMQVPKSKLKTIEKITKSYKKPAKDVLRFESVDAAESQIRSMKVKPPSDKSEDALPYYSKDIDVSDLVAAVGYQDTDEDLLTLLETTTEEIPDEVEEPVLQAEEKNHKESENYEKIKSFSFAVKNTPSSYLETDYTYAEESQPKYSVAADDYTENDEDDMTDEYSSVSKLKNAKTEKKYKYKFPKTKKGIPDPIYVKVPKDSIVY